MSTRYNTVRSLAAAFALLVFLAHPMVAVAGCLQMMQAELPCHHDFDEPEEPTPAPAKEDCCALLPAVPVAPASAKATPVSASVALVTPGPSLMSDTLAQPVPAVAEQHPPLRLPLQSTLCTFLI